MSDIPPESLPAAPGTVPLATPLKTHDLVVSMKVAYAVLALGVALGGLALLFSGLLWQKLGNIQEELARRSLDSGAQAIEARTLARAAQETTRELAARLTLQENRISEVSLQRTQLEELMQSLSRSRDENLVVDIESAIRLAQQQAQLAGSPVPLVAALTSALQRLQRAAQPRLSPLQRAIVKDLERIKTASLTDVPALMIKIDELSRMTDELPVANAMPAAASAKLEPLSTKSADGKSISSWSGLLDVQPVKAAASRVLDTLRDEGRKLLRVSRIEQPEAALLSPEQSFFLRENLKLRLLNARLGLLARQTDTARADLQNASAWLGKYFDPASRKTQAATQLLIQVQSQLKTSELPLLDDTMAALATAAAGR